MIELLVGVALGWVVGFTLGRRRKSEAPVPEEVCQCGHGSAFHDRTGCHLILYQHEKKIIGRTAYDSPVIQETRVPGSGEECRCLRYVGPGSSYLPELDG